MPQPIPQPAAPATSEPPQMTPDGMPNPEAFDDGRHSILQSMFADIQRKHKQADSAVILGAEKIRMMKEQFLQQVFDQLKKAGVDPSDPQSINSFLQQLASQDPDLLQLFEDAFKGLQPDSDKSGLGGNLLPLAPPTGMQGQPQDAPAIDPGMLDRIRGMQQ